MLVSYAARTARVNCHCDILVVIKDIANLTIEDNMPICVYVIPTISFLNLEQVVHNGTGRLDLVALLGSTLATVRSDVRYHCLNIAFHKILLNIPKYNLFRRYFHYCGYFGTLKTPLQFPFKKIR
jgi:hypothetical protein